MIGEIERRQSKLLREHSEHMGELLDYRRRTEQNLAEITDKLNGLIGFIDGMESLPRPS